MAICHYEHTISARKCEAPTPSSISVALGGDLEGVTPPKACEPKPHARRHRETSNESVMCSPHYKGLCEWTH
ncbi:hypothetical protein PPUN12996_46460 [Pseudomonas putida]|nr:hypothetical protein PPUN12996_46460 [Pseudomonas putida]